MTEVKNRNWIEPLENRVTLNGDGTIQLSYTFNKQEPTKRLLGKRKRAKHEQE